MANRIHELPQTRGNFRVTGVVTGTQKQNFYTEKKARNNKNFRALSFGVQYAPLRNVYMSLNGFERDVVYFSKTENGKTTTKAVKWQYRNMPDTDGFKPIGVSVGLKKIVSEKGTMINDQVMLADFDACEYISENIDDGDSVFVRGNIDYSSFIDDNGNTRRYVKQVPTQISLTNEPLDINEFDDMDVVEANKKHAFSQRIVFTGIEKETVNDKLTGRFILSGKIIGYSDIVDAEFIIKNKDVATWLKRTLKPYNAIDVYGVIDIIHSVEESNSENPSEANPMAYVSAPSKIEMVVIGAADQSIDTTTYTEANVTEAISKVRASKMATRKFEAPKQVEASDDDMDSDW